MNKELKITLRVDAKTGEVTAVRNSFDTLERSVAKTTVSLKGVRYALAGIASALYVNKIISYADTYTSLNSQLRLVTGSSREFQEVQKQMLTIANDARMQLGGTVDLYAKLKRSTEELGYAQNTLLDVTESITKAMIISGGSQESMNAAIMQLGQGLASGALRGEELNSVMEQTPRLAQAIAEGMGTGIGELRALAQEGKITSKVVIDALMSQAAAIDQEFSQVSMTVSQAMSVAENTMTVLVGQIDTASGASAGLAKSIVSVTQALLDNKTLVMDLSKQVLVLGGAFAVFKTGKLLSPLIGELKLTSDAFKVQMALAKMDGVALGTLDKIALETSISMKALGSAVKSFALSNAPMLALVAVFEAWNYVAEESAKRERELADAMNIHADAASHLTKAQATNNLYLLQEELKVHRETTQELLLQLKMARGRSYEQNEETVAIRAKLDTVKEESNEIKKQITLMQQVVDGTYEADAAAMATANSAADTANNIAAAAQNAYELASALGSAMVSLEKESIRAQQLSGEISKRKALALSADAEIRNIDAQMQALSNLYAQKNANIDKLNTKVIQLAAQRLRVENNLTESLSKEENKQLNMINKTHAAAVSSARKMAAEQKRAAEEYTEALHKAEETLENARLYNLGGDELIKIKQIGDKLADLGKYLKQSELAEIYESEMSKMNADTDRFTNSFANAFQNILDGDISTAFKSFFNNISTTLVKPWIEDISKSLSSGLSSMLGGLGSFGTAAIGISVGFLGSLLEDMFNSGTVWTREDWIDANDIATSPESETVNTLLESMDKTLANSLRYTKGMYDNLKIIAESTGKAGVSIAGSYDFTLQDSYTQGALGGLWGGTDFSTLAKGMELQMEGLELEIGRMFTTTQTTKTSWFGLKSSTSQKTTYSYFTKEVLDAINSAYGAMGNALVDASERLGVTGAEAIISSFEGAIHRLDTAGMDSSEISDMLAGVISSDMDALAERLFAELEGNAARTVMIPQFNSPDTFSNIIPSMYDWDFDALTDAQQGVIDTINNWAQTNPSAPTDWLGWQEVTVATVGLEEFANAGESAGETFVRLSDQFAGTEYIWEQLGNTFEGFGLSGIELSDALIQAAGGTTAALDLFDSYRDNYYSDEERLTIDRSILEKDFDYLKEQYAGLTSGMVEDLPDTREEFRKLVDGIDTSTISGMEFYVEMIKLSEGFADITEQANESVDAITGLSVTWSDLYGTIGSIDSRMLELNGATNEEKALENLEYAKQMLDTFSTETGISGSIDDIRSMMLTMQESGDLSSDLYKQYSTMADATLDVMEAEKALSDIRQEALDSLLKEHADLQYRLDYLAADDAMKRLMDRNKELSGYTDETSRAILRQIYAEEDRQKALEDLQSAIDAANSAIYSLSSSVVSDYNSAMSDIENAIQKQYDSMIALSDAYAAVSDSIADYIDTLTHIPISYDEISAKYEEAYRSIGAGNTIDDYNAMLERIKTLYDESMSAVNTEYDARIDAYKLLIDEQNEIIQKEFDAKKESLEAQKDALEKKEQILSAYRDFATSIKNDIASQSYDYDYFSRMANSTFGKEESIGYAKSAIDAYKEIAANNSDYKFESLKTANRYGQYGDRSVQGTIDAISRTLDDMSVTLIDYTEGVDDIEAQRTQAIDALKLETVSLLESLDSVTRAAAPSVVEEVAKLYSSSLSILGETSDMTAWLQSIYNVSDDTLSFSDYKAKIDEENAKTTIASINATAATIESIGAEYSLAEDLNNQTNTLAKKLDDLVAEVRTLREKTEEQNEALIDNTSTSVFEVAS